MKSLQQNEIATEQTKQKTVCFDTSAYHSIENDLKTLFATKVKLSNKKNKGKIEIEYYSNDDLDRILALFKAIQR